MRVQRMVVPLSLALMGLGGCNVYERWDGEEFNAGAVNAQNFPPAYLGNGTPAANRLNSGSGTFTARRAYVGGATSEHFLFPISTRQRAATLTAALTVSGLGAANAYEFEPGCKTPEGYEFDAARDAYDYTRQGTIFSALPAATYAVGAEPTWNYVPLVARVKVTPNGLPCQLTKSEANLVKRKDVALNLTDPAPVTGKQVGVPEAGVYDAFAIIEPGAGVYHFGQTSTMPGVTGLGVQKWGWFNQYLLAYIDGGQVPVATGRLVTQKLYYPRSLVTLSTGDARVAVGGGYDVVEARRGAAGYSPVCEVFTYDAGGPLTPAQLPKSAADIVANFGTTLLRPTRAFGNVFPVGDPYVYCLQAE